MAKTALDPVGWSGGSYNDPISWGDAGPPPLVVKNVSDSLIVTLTESPLAGIILNVSDALTPAISDTGHSAVSSGTAPPDVIRNVSDALTPTIADTGVAFVVGGIVKNVSDSLLVQLADTVAKNILGGGFVKNVSDTLLLTITDTAIARPLGTPGVHNLFVDSDARVQLVIESDARLTGTLE